MIRIQIELKNIQTILDRITDTHYGDKIPEDIWHYVYGAYCNITSAIDEIDNIMNGIDETSQIVCNSDKDNI